LNGRTTRLGGKDQDAARLSFVYVLLGGPYFFRAVGPALSDQSMNFSTTSLLRAQT
jgi:hypothetical protein